MLCSSERIDPTVTRLLTGQFALGLFENPAIDERAADAVHCVSYAATAGDGTAGKRWPVPAETDCAILRVEVTNSHEVTGASKSSDPATGGLANPATGKAGSRTDSQYRGQQPGAVAVYLINCRCGPS